MLPLSEAEREIINHFSHKKKEVHSRGGRTRQGGKVEVLAVVQTHVADSPGSENIGRYCVSTTTWKFRVENVAFCDGGVSVGVRHVATRRSNMRTESKSLSYSSAGTLLVFWCKANRKHWRVVVGGFGWGAGGGAGGGAIPLSSSQSNRSGRGFMLVKTFAF